MIYLNIIFLCFNILKTLFFSYFFNLGTPNTKWWILQFKTIFYVYEFTLWILLSSFIQRLIIIFGNLTLFALLI